MSPLTINAHPDGEAGAPNYPVNPPVRPTAIYAAGQKQFTAVADEQVTSAGVMTLLALYFDAFDTPEWQNAKVAKVGRTTDGGNYWRVTRAA